MEESTLNFAKQFAYKPEIKNSDKFKSDYKNFVLSGMGGSHLAAGILQAYKPGINLYVHRDYGIPAYDADFCKNALFIASSYSGNTEEVIDFLDEAYSRGFDTLVIATSGKLIEFAERNNLPYIQMPQTGIQPRLALGYSLIALASVVLPESLPELATLATRLNPASLKSEASSIAKTLVGKIPVIYTSTRNRAVAYNWKIKFNESAKIPAFYNSFPELNHNEMQGYDFADSNKNLSENFHFIIIKDESDDNRIIKRMDTVQELFEEKGYGVTQIYLLGESRLEQIFNSLILADWITLELATEYKTEPSKVPLIEEFKKRIV